MKNLAKVGVIFLTLLVSQTGQAQQVAGAGPGFGQGRFARELGLTPEQMQELALENPGERWQQRRAWFAEKQKLHAMLRDKTVSEKDIVEQFEKVNSQKSGFEQMRLKKMLRAREILNEEQLQKLSDMMEERMAERKDPGWSGRGGRGPGSGGRPGDCRCPP